MDKIVIKNRKHQKISILIKREENQKGLSFVMHGWSGFKEQPHIQTIAEAFTESEYTVIRFDTTNTLGESDGKPEDATVGSFYNDLEDVIKWAKTQNWYQEPFTLAGHSLGGMVITLFAENYPDKIMSLALISATISGDLLYKTHSEQELKKWQVSGWKTDESKSKPGVMKRMPWSFMEDTLKYDLLKSVDKLNMPVLLITGENDTGTPPEHQKILYNALPGPRKLHIIKGSAHTFRDPVHLAEIKQIFKQWLAKLK